MSDIRRIGDFSLTWGESLRWDDRRGRLYFVDCATNQLHWLDGAELEGAEPRLHSLALPSLPTGVAPTEDGRLVIAMGDGIYVVDADAEAIDLLTPYPA